MFRWRKDARRFLSRHHRALTERPVAIFALGPGHDPHDEDEWQKSQAQLDKQLAKFPWLIPSTSICCCFSQASFSPLRSQGTVRSPALLNPSVPAERLIAEGRRMSYSPGIRVLPPLPHFRTLLHPFAPFAIQASL
jgi:hypothetical protein